MDMQKIQELINKTAKQRSESRASLVELLKGYKSELIDKSLRSIDQEEKENSNLATNEANS